MTCLTPKGNGCRCSSGCSGRGGAAASRRGPGNGALQGTLTAGGALAGYNAGKLASEKLDDTNLDAYLGKPGLQVLKAIAQIGGTAAGGYGGFKAGERLWLG